MTAHEPHWPMTHQQKELQRKAREFARSQIFPRAQALDETAAFAGPLYTEMARIGLLGITIPTRWGGVGADTLSYALVMEELSVGYASVADLCGLVELCATLLYELGTEAQKELYLTPLLHAQTTCAFALTEPDAGSDLGALTSTAEKTGDGYRLNGTKHFIHNGPICDFALVLARSPGRKDQRRPMSIFVVDADTPGFSRGVKEHKMGQRASQLSSLYFKDCRLDPKAVLGNEGDGFKHMMMVLERGRIGIAALSLGLMRACLENLRHIAIAGSDDGSLSQTVQWAMADLATDIFAARAMITHAARLKDQDIQANMHASMAKLFASEAAVKHTGKAFQSAGLKSYARGHVLERLYRDAKVTQIYEGTSEVQRIIISRSLKDTAP